jgi:hypothetical protein
VVFEAARVKVEAKNLSQLVDAALDVENVAVVLLLLKGQIVLVCLSVCA